jgi:hypothetical protein
MFHYTAYGLLVQSELELPELLAVPEPQATRAFDVVIRTGRVEPRPPEGLATGVFYHVTPQLACSQWTDAGIYSVSEGRDIIVEPCEGADPRAIRLYLVNSILAVLLHQRRFLVLHASAVAVRSVAVAFLGNCGSGKSTTAASLHARGWPLLSDDVIAIETPSEGKPLVRSAFPQLKLCPDAAEVFSSDVQSLTKVHPDEDKRLRPAHDGFAGDRILPLSRLYMLQDAEKLEIVPMSPREALPMLISNSFTAHILEVTEARRSHFEQCVRLMETARIKTLRRPRDLSSLPRLAELVEDDARD